MTILITGGAGFIGSNVVKVFNEAGCDDIIIVDRLGKSDKWKNLVGLKIRTYLELDRFPEWYERNHPALMANIKAVIHLGACSNTQERNMGYLIDNNYSNSQIMSHIAYHAKVPFIYASSAATYGNLGFHDDFTEDIPLIKLKPVNAYGMTKHMFDLYMNRGNKFDKEVYGLKFFNVFGSGEDHKVGMKSFVRVAIEALFSQTEMNFFDTPASRDFVYVKDVANLILAFYIHKPQSGIYNVGSGVATPLANIADVVSMKLHKKLCNKLFTLRTPEGYQDFTRANMTKTHKTFPNFQWTPIDEAIDEYIGELKRDCCF